MKTFTIILFVLLLPACSDFRSTDKYQLVTSSDGTVYRLDKSSGEVWFIKGNTMEKVQAAQIFQPLPGESYTDYLKRAKAAGIGEHPVEKRKPGESIPEYLERTAPSNTTVVPKMKVGEIRDLGGGVTIKRIK